jgi:uncharacterized surface protein with fasciclin (FAS1) repeats
MGMDGHVRRTDSASRRSSMSRLIALPLIAVLSLSACAAPEEAADVAPTEAPAATEAPAVAPAALPPVDENNILSIAIASPDHTTLVAAVKAADLVTAVAASGPLTVFAPTDAAFAKLPAGTVEGLLAPDKKADLANILTYHVAPSAYDESNLVDGQVLGMANGGKVTIHIKDGKIMANDANVVASVKASNGVIHVIDAVLLPPAE